MKSYHLPFYQALARFSLIFSLLLMLNACASVISATTGDDGLEENRERRSAGSMMDDSSIETIVKVNLNAADETIKQSNISVISYNAVVLLVGQVPTAALKDLATRIATSSNSRIKNVHNELVVGGETSFLSRTGDAWITTKVKTLMLANKNVSGLKTKVVTSNGVVYLMGLMTHAQADRTSELARRTKGVENVVRAFEYLD